VVAATATITSLRTGRRDLAVAVTRTLLLSIYAATLSALSLRTAPMGQWMVAVALPILSAGYFLYAPAIRRRFGDGFASRLADAALRLLSRDAAVTVLLMLTSLVIVLTASAVPSIRTFGPRFIVGREWRPNALPGPPVRDAKGQIVYDDDGNQLMTEIPPALGALPVIYGTAVSSAIALLFAVPLSLGTAVFLVRIAAGWLVAPVSFLVEFLAAVPSIAYGIWGLFVMGPFLRQHVEPSLNQAFLHTPGLRALGVPAGAVAGRDMLAGGLILGVMVVPIITAIARDVLRNVPRAQVEGTVALGATWWESSKEMLKFSRSGLFGAVMLGLARAAGETMAITMVIGNNNQIRASLFAPAQTMSSLLANEFGDTGGDLQRAALTEVALILLVMSLAFNVVARYLVVGRGARTASAH
jgi:phosphate transport system permease protein